MSGALAPLRHRGFRRLVAGQLASGIGDASYAVALPWYVLATHGGALLLGTVLAAYGIPRTLGILAGGHASDRWRPWTVMMSSDLVRALAVGALAAAAALGPARAAVLVPIAVAVGAGEGFFLPGSYAIVPALLPDEDLQPGNALAAAVTYLALLAGPAAGGALVATAGPAPAFALDAVSFAVSAASLLGVRAARPRPPAAIAPAVAPQPAPAQTAPSGTAPGQAAPAQTAPSGTAPGQAAPAQTAPSGTAPSGTAPGQAAPAHAGPAGTAPGQAAPAHAAPAHAGPAHAGPAQAGLAQAAPPATAAGQVQPVRLWPLVRSSRILMIILLVMLTANLGSGGADQVALPALAHGPLHAGAAGYGLLIAAFSAGALAGTLLAGQLRRTRRPAVLGSLTFLASALLIAVIPLAPSTLLAAGILAGYGVLNGLGNIVMITMFQRWAPPALLGRLTGLLMLASVGIFPVSAALGALVVHGLGPGPFFPMTAGALAVAITVGLSQRQWRELGTPRHPPTPGTLRLATTPDATSRSAAGQPSTISPDTVNAAAD